MASISRTASSVSSNGSKAISFDLPGGLPSMRTASGELPPARKRGPRLPVPTPGRSFRQARDVPGRSSSLRHPESLERDGLRPRHWRRRHWLDAFGPKLQHPVEQLTACLNPLPPFSVKHTRLSVTDFKPAWFPALYSVRNARIGSIAAARAAGASAATKAQRPSEAIAIERATGSQIVTPYS